MKKATLLLTTLIGLAGVSTAFAADSGGSGFYVLGGVGQTTDTNSQSDVDNLLRSLGGTGFSSSYGNPTVYKLAVGYQLNKYFAAEAGYVNSSNATYSATGGNLGGTLSMSAKISGWNLTGVGILPINDQFSLLAKLGVADSKLSGSASFGGQRINVDGSKSDATYGLGAKYDFNKSLFGRFDVDSYKIGSSVSSSRTTVWMIDLGYKF